MSGLPSVVTPTPEEVSVTCNGLPVASSCHFSNLRIAGDQFLIVTLPVIRWAIYSAFQKNRDAFEWPMRHGRTH